jgi:hypothetical protein
VELYLVAYIKLVLSQPAMELRVSLATPGLMAVQDAISNMSGLSSEEVSQRLQVVMAVVFVVVVVRQPVYTKPILCRRLSSAVPIQAVETRHLSTDEELHQCILVAVHAAGMKHSIPTSLLQSMKRQQYDTRSPEEAKDAALVKGLGTGE